MKREIKFRAWSNEYREMYYKDFDDFVMPENAAIFESGLNRNGELFVGHYLEGGDYEDLELMQFTKLKDKNGKEVYEGDIVKWGHVVGGEEKPIRIAIVEMHPDIFFRNIADGYEFHYAKFAYQDTHNWIEVIGNIYEHPELLNQDK